MIIVAVIALAIFACILHHMGVPLTNSNSGTNNIIGFAVELLSYICAFVAAFAAIILLLGA